MHIPLVKVAVALLAAAIFFIAGYLWVMAWWHIGYGPTNLPPDAIRCWGWFEGTHAGRAGTPCPSWWPVSSPVTGS